MDVVVEVRDGRRQLRDAGELGALLGLAAGDHLVVEEALPHLAEHRGEQALVVRGRADASSDVGGHLGAVMGERLGHRGGVAIQEQLRQHLVQHQGADVVAALAQQLQEELRLAGRRDLQGRHHDERRLRPAEQRGHGPGPLDEAVVHRLEEHEELGDVLQELRAEDAVGDRVERLGGEAHQPRPVRGDQPAQQSRREEVRHPVRGVEEVDRVAGGGRVHHDQVVAARGVDLVEALHGHVVVALDELAGDVLVQRVDQDRVAGGGVGGVQADQVVPGLLGVQHGGPQLALGLDTGRGERLGRHLRLDVAEALEPQRVGQPLGRVDGQHQHLAAQVGGRRGTDRRGGGRLADAAGAGRHDDLLGRAQLLDRRRGHDV